MHSQTSVESLAPVPGAPETKDIDGKMWHWCAHRGFGICHMGQQHTRTLPNCHHFTPRPHKWPLPLLQLVLHPTQASNSVVKPCLARNGSWPDFPVVLLLFLHLEYVASPLLFMGDHLGAFHLLLAKALSLSLLSADKTQTLTTSGV